jgi:ribosomal protein S18 acetylase RimI-like enzyme
MVLSEDPAAVDLAQLAALFTAVGFRRPFDPSLLHGMVTGSRWVVSAWDGPRMVGFCRAISDGVSNGYVSTVAVLPSHQRQGIGRAMMERLLAGKPGIKFVLHTSEAGAGLYRALGFADATRMMVRDRA